MTKYDTVSISAGRDANYPLHGRCEYVIFAPNDGPVLKRETGFKNKAQAQRAGIKAAQEFLA